MHDIDAQGLDQLPDLPALIDLRGQTRKVARGEGLDSGWQSLAQPPERAVGPPLFDIEHLQLLIEKDGMVHISNISSLEGEKVELERRSADLRRKEYFDP